MSAHDVSTILGIIFHAFPAAAGILWCFWGIRALVTEKPPRLSGAQRWRSPMSFGLCWTGFGLGLLLGQLGHLVGGSAQSPLQDAALIAIFAGAGLGLAKEWYLRRLGATRRPGSSDNS
jgi:hypothetical protein